MKKLRVTL